MARAPFLAAFLLAVTCLAGACAFGAVSQSNNDCLVCHSKQGGARPVDPSLLGRSVHRELECVACHTQASTLPHAERMSPVNCGDCHGDVLTVFQGSVHGLARASGIEEAAYCTDCHGNHLILSSKDRASLTYPTAIRSTCGSCHAAERITGQYGMPNDVVKTYDQSYHGLAARYGSTKVANCASCHGYHNILPASDPASSVSKANISSTCGKCHPGAGPRLTNGRVHSNPIRSKNTVVRYVIVFYVLFICLVIGGMFVHNLLDFARKLARHFRATKDRAKESRFVLSERLQHVALTVVFFVLAYSGFARRFPDAWWSSPFRLFDHPASTRGMIHRVAAAIFIALCAYHVWFVSLTRRGRQQLSDLKPTSRDLKDAYLVARYNVGGSAEPPDFGPYSYIEKSEYWALVWGAAVMIITGLALVFANFTLKHFPLWVAELVTSIHFYEAVLAALAVLVWHLYWTIFDPRVYPMNWSWITGRTAEKRLTEPSSEREKEKPGHEPQPGPDQLEAAKPTSGKDADVDGAAGTTFGKTTAVPPGPTRRTEGSE